MHDIVFMEILDKHGNVRFTCASDDKMCNVAKNTEGYSVRIQQAVKDVRKSEAF